MALTAAYVQVIQQLPQLMEKIKQAQAPDKVTVQLLKDWGFTSTNHRAFIPLLKELGYLSSDGAPTQRYKDYRNHARSKQILGEALKQAYSDIFLINENPTKSDKDAITGKFKSFHNVNDRLAGLMSATFYKLLDLADLSAVPATPPPRDTAGEEGVDDEGSDKKEGKSNKGGNSDHRRASLHYNIQIHLPPTRDLEVYNAIFKSLKTHLID